MFTLKTWIKTNSDGILNLLPTTEYLVIHYYNGRVELRDIRDPKSTQIPFPQIPLNYPSIGVQDNSLYCIYWASGQEKVAVWGLDQELTQKNILSNLQAPKALKVSPAYLILKSDEGIEVFDRKTHTSKGILYTESVDYRNRYFPLAINKDLLLESPQYDKVRIWNLKTFQLECELSPTIPNIATCTWMNDYVLLATEANVEDEEPCQVFLWDYRLNSIQRLPLTIEMEESFYYRFHTSPSLNKDFPTIWLYAIAFSWVDVWDGSTWKHLARIDTQGDTSATCLVGDTLYVGNKQGYLTLFKYTE